LAFAPIFARASPIALIAASQAALPSAKSPEAPRSLARPPHADLRSPSISAESCFKLMAAVSPPFNLPAACASSLNSFCQSKLATASTLAMSGQFPGAPGIAGAPGTLGIFPQSMSKGDPSAVSKTGKETIRQQFFEETIVITLRPSSLDGSDVVHFQRPTVHKCAKTRKARLALPLRNCIQCALASAQGAHPNSARDRVIVRARHGGSHAHGAVPFRSARHCLARGSAGARAFGFAGFAHATRILAPADDQRRQIDRRYVSKIAAITSPATPVAASDRTWLDV
jgi:hypothetical protein